MFKITSEDLLAMTAEEFMDKSFGLHETGAVIIGGVEHLTDLRMLQCVGFTYNYNRKYRTPIAVEQLPDPGSSWVGKGYRDWLDIALITVERFSGIEARVLSLLTADISEKLLYNALRRCEEYTISADIEDFEQFSNDAELVEARQDVKDNYDLNGDPTEEYGRIAAVNDLLDAKCLEPAYNKNAVANLVNMGELKRAKFHQGNGFVGYATEVNSEYYKYPVLFSYAEGCKSYYACAALSRQASQDLLYKGAVVADSELENRLSFLTASSVFALADEDCGSKIGYQWVCAEDNFEAFVGKHYWLGDVHGVIKEGDLESLLGKTLTIRNPAGCITENDSGVCRTCIGEMSKTWYPEWAIGHVSQVEFRGPVAEMVISVKHTQDGKMRVEYNLPENLKRILRHDRARHCLRLDVRDKSITSVQLILPINAEALAIDGIFGLDNIEKYDVGCFSGLTYVEIQVNRKDELESETIPLRVNAGAGKANVSRELLKAILENKDIMTTGGGKRSVRRFISLPMDGIEVLRLPFRQIAMPDFASAIKGFLNSTIRPTEKDITKLSKFTDFGQAVVFFHSMLKDKVPMPIAVLELTIHSLTVRDQASRDWRTVKGSNYVRFASNASITEHRSLSAKFTEERMRQLFTMPSTYLEDKRMANVFDAVFDI